MQNVPLLETFVKQDLARLRADALEELFTTSDAVVLSGKAAQPHLERLRRRLEEEAAKLINKRPAFEWLWYLRRLRGQFNWNGLETTDPYCQALAEALCSLSTKPEPGLVAGGPFNTVFPVEEADVRDLLRLRELVGLIYENHGTTRYAGKGCDIRFSREDGSESVPTPAMSRAVKLYDSRHASRHNILARAGLAADLQVEINKANIFSTFMVAAGQPGSSVAPEWNGTVDAPMGFGFGTVDLSQIDILTNRQLAVELRWPRPLPALLALSLVPLQPWFATVRGTGDIFRRYGYFYVSRQFLMESLEWSLEIMKRGDGDFIPVEVLPASAEAVVEDLLGVEVSAYPPTGGLVLHELGEMFVVDLDSAADALLRCLDRPVSDGAEVNEWSDTFEIHVQEIINRSDWAPEADTAALRARHLRIGGVDLTNVDAIGEREDVLIIVSCKSRPYNRAYDRGEYGEVRNVRTLAEDSVEFWQTIVATVEENPVGDNYDFSRFKRIVGVVVLPFAPFVLEGTCTAEAIEGLRWVSSSIELRDWCAGTE